MTISPLSPALAGLIVALSLPLGAAAFAQGTDAASRDDRPDHAATTPASPAPRHHQAVPPSERLHDAPNQINEQVAPIPDPPVKPGTNVAPGQDTPKPHR